MSSLDRILGNDRVKEYIRTAVGLNRISHSYLIEGEKGSGKKTLAESFARILQCEGEGKKDCGQCTSCIQMDHKNHPDVIRLVHDKPNTISVDDVRNQIINTADVIPYRAPYKIYIIDEAEKMTVEAQNALLKTIEDPPEYVILFLLVANRGVMLDTILSRCILLQTMPLKRETISRYLTDHENVLATEADFAAGYAMGNMGKALESIRSEQFGTWLDMARKILRKLPSWNMEEMADLAKELTKEKEGISVILELFMIWYRDLLVLKVTDDESKIIYRGEEYNLYSQAGQIKEESTDAMLREICHTQKRLRANVNPEAVLLVLLVKMNREFRRK